MVPELRKRHRLIWQIGSLFMVLGFLGTVLVLPRDFKQSHLILQIDAPLPKVLSTKTSSGLTIKLRQGVGPQKQLELINNEASDIPLGQLFCNKALLGTLGSKGVQRFFLSDSLSLNPPYLLEIFDPINQKTIDKIVLP